MSKFNDLVNCQENVLIDILNTYKFSTDELFNSIRLSKNKELELHYSLFTVYNWEKFVTKKSHIVSDFINISYYYKNDYKIMKIMAEDTNRKVSSKLDNLREKIDRYKYD